MPSQVYINCLKASVIGRSRKGGKLINMINYKKNLEAIEQMENVIKMNIINDIKEYMKNHSLNQLLIRLEEDDDRVDEENLDEYDSLYTDVEDDIFNTAFDYYTGDTNSAEPNKVYIDDEGKLMLECELVGFDRHSSWGADEPEIFCEEGLMKYCPSDILNQILLNVQNEKFQRMNELIAEE